jgi:hypothetical protein
MPGDFPVSKIELFIGKRYGGGRGSLSCIYATNVRLCKACYGQVESELKNPVNMQYRSLRNDSAPACAPVGGAANVTVRQRGHSRPGSSHSVTLRTIFASMTCAHRGSAGSAPSRAALRERHSAGGPQSSPRPNPDPVSAFFLATGLSAPLAVLPALPLGLLSRPPCLFRSDPLLGAWRPRVTDAHQEDGPPVEAAATAAPVADPRRLRGACRAPRQAGLSPLESAGRNGHIRHYRG